LRLSLVAYLTNRNMRELGLTPGLEVVAEIETSSIHLLTRDAAGAIALRSEPRGAGVVLVAHF